MAFVPPGAGYDRAITVFSPDGRLFQVQYAQEAVKRGKTAIGIKCEDGIVLLVERKVTSRLIEPRSIEKIFQIDDHIGAATSGLVADARSLIEYARVRAQVHRLLYDEPISVPLLAKEIGDLKQQYTQFGGVRPFGAALLIGGVNKEEVYLFQTDPSGALYEYRATAIGGGQSSALDFLEKNYSEDLGLEGAIDLALKTLDVATEIKLREDRVEMAIISKEDRKFRKLSDKEVREYIEKYVVK